MRLSSCVRARNRAVRAPGKSLALVIALVLTGCAGDQSPSHESAWLGAVPPPRVAMEGDGLPAQTPPLLRNEPQPDDPTEPFSPNYGPPPEPRREPAPVQQPIPQDLPPKFRTQLAIALGG